MYVVIKVACDTDFSRQIGDTHHFDLVNFDDVKSYRIHKKSSFQDFQALVASDFSVPIERQRYWIWSQRHNGTIRPDSPLGDERELKTVLDLQRYKEKSYMPLEKHALMTIKLYLEKPDKETGMLKELSNNDLLLFCKLYDPYARKLSYVGHLFVDKNMLFKDIFNLLKKMVGMDENDEILAYEEVKFEPSVMCNDLDGTGSPVQVRIYEFRVNGREKVLLTLHCYFSFRLNSSKAISFAFSGRFQARKLKTSSSPILTLSCF